MSVPEPRRPVSPTGAPAPGRATLPVLGVDACRGGWVGAVLDASGRGRVRVAVGATVAQVLAAAGEVAVVGVDIPIGLPDASRREADVLTRRFLGPAKTSSVFTTPTRAAVEQADYATANVRNRELVGVGLSKQAHGLRRSILEVDAWVRRGVPCPVLEVHPEASFAAMSGAALTTRKRTAEGAAHRRAVLAAVGIQAPREAPRGAATDDLLDACAAAWSAHRASRGEALTFPDEPEVFGDGLRAAIHV